VRLLVAGGLALAVLAVFLLAGTAVLHGLAGAAGRALGYQVGYVALRFSKGRLTVDGPEVRSLHGEPIFTADRIELAYSLRELAGGPYLYGITGVDLVRPRFTLVRHRDGSYNVSFPAANPHAGPVTLPRIRVTVRDGSAGLLDDTRIFAHSRRLALQDLQLSADVNPKERSTFSIAFAVQEEGGSFPFAGHGTLDERRGFELSRITARSVALGPLLDYALNSPTLHFAGGVLNSVDARAYGLPDHAGTMQRHISVTANLDHFQPYLNGLAKPLRDGRGAVRVYDAGVTFPKIDGSIAGVPVRIAGAVYDLARPTVRLGITGHGDVRQLLTLNAAGKALPVNGPVGFKLLVEGDAAAPTTLATFASPRLLYGRIPLEKAGGLVALRGQEADVVRARLRYDGIDAGARGVVLLATHTGVELVATVSAPARRVPFAAGLLGGMRVRGTAVTAGVDSDLLTRGILTGGRPGQRLAGTFSVDGRGVGSIGPFALDGPGRQALYARVALDRPHFGGGVAIISARDVHFSTEGPQPDLPGITVPLLPRADGTLGAALLATFAGKHFAAAGDAHVTGAHVLGYPVDDVTARFAASDPERIALQGRYRGALDALARAAGSRLTVHGRADVPFTVLARGPSDALAQIHDVRFSGASVAGVSLDAFEGTAGLHGGALDIYAARARAGGNDIVAQGRFGNGGTLALSASDVDLAALRAFGLPVRTGTLTAVGTIGGTVDAPTAQAGIAAGDVTSSDPRFAGLPVSASGALSLRGDTLTLRDGQVVAGNALVAALDGRLNGIRSDPKNAAYVFDARLRQADVATLARVARVPLRYAEGSLDAEMRVAGRGAAPRVAGRLALPEGSLNGLRFRDASLRFAGTPAAGAVRDGRVTVGTSMLAFSGDASRGRQSATLSAPRIDLSDFNDYFDRGDTLGGAGSIALAVTNTPDALVTSGRIRLTHTRLRRFDVGDSAADWSTAGRVVRANAAIGGPRGRVHLLADVTEPATQPLRDTLRRSYLNLTASVAGVDVGTLLPIVDVQIPLEGTVDASATAHGSFPNVSMAGHAALTNGLLQRIPIRTASINVSAAGGRASIAGAVFAIDNLTARATGSVGLSPGAPVDVTLVAQTADAGALAKTVTGTTYDASGAVTTTLRVTGALQHPSIEDTLDADQLRYARYTLPHAHSDVAVTATRVTVRSAEADLASGRLLAAGYVPLQLRPTPGIGPATAPLALDLTIDHVGLGQFADLLPKGTQTQGTLDGRVALGGSQANPGLSGSLALAGGSFSGPQERSKITDAAITLNFAERTVTLENTHATIGGGAVSAGGSVTVADLRDPARSATANVTLNSANADFDFPQFFRGRVLGALTLSRNAGAPLAVGGTLALSSMRIPLTAILTSGTPQAKASAAPVAVAFDLGVDVGNDVRVQSGPVDIGAKGDIRIGGTLAAPTASGKLTATDGTISFYRTFAIQYPSTVTFERSDGLIPYVDATATTSVSNPPTDVTLHVTGPATQLNVALASDPNYSREQILGLLVGAQALGAVSGVAATSGGAVGNPFGALAEGELGTLLTQNLLQPFSSQIGSAVGLNGLAVNYAPGAGGVSIGAQKKLFKNVSAVFAQSFNYPPRQSVGLIASPNDRTAIQLSFFTQQSLNTFQTTDGGLNLQSTNQALTVIQPLTGTNGFAFSIQRKFK
jgi:autotransporter translocation and assembly factor TamB